MEYEAWSRSDRSPSFHYRATRLDCNSQSPRPRKLVGQAARHLEAKTSCQANINILMHVPTCLCATISCRRFAFVLTGSCNGLQHYAALGLDAMGGAQVNLVPSSQPQDVYSGVCDVVKQKV